MIHHFKILFHALRTEPLSQVVRNVFRFVSGKSRPIIQRDNNALFCSEYATIINDRLLIGGWVAGISGHIQAMSIDWQNGPNVKLGIPINRSDILHLLPKDAVPQNKGFVFDHKIPEGSIPEDIKAHCLLDGGKEVSFFIKLKPLKEVLQYIGASRLNQDEVYTLLVEKSRLRNKINKQQLENTTLFFFNEMARTTFLKRHPQYKNQVASFKGDLEFTTDSLKTEWICLIGQGSNIYPDSITEISPLLKSNADLIYTDHDYLVKGKRFNPSFKPNFSYDYLLSTNYIGNVLFVRKEKFMQLFPVFDKKINAHELLILAYENQFKIKHLRKVYWYHRIKNNLSSRKAIQRHLERKGIKAKVGAGLVENTFHVKREVRPGKLVSIIIPFKDDVETLKTCVNSIFAKTEYKHFELLLVSNNSKERKTFDYLNKITKQFPKKVRKLEHNIPFNYAAINNWAVKQCHSEYVLLLNNDTEVISRGWLKEMLSHIQRPDVGAVGAKLRYPDRSIQHAGVIVGLHGVADHAFSSFEENETGYMNRINLVQNFSACTAACLLIKRKVFDKIGGFDAENFKVNFNDVDLCLEMRKRNYLIVYTPFAELFHYESKTRGDNTSTPEKRQREAYEIRYFKQKWKDFLLKGDPYYNPNLTLNKTDFSLNISDLI